MSAPSLADLRSAKRVLASRFLTPEEEKPWFAPYSLPDALASAGAQVHAVGIGLKVVAGGQTAERCVRLHVLRKIVATQLSPPNLLPSEIDGIPTDVVETPRAVLQAFPCGSKEIPHAVLRPGLSISGPRTTPGTLGCLVRRDGGIHVLSCSHVLADSSSQPKDSVFHPGLADVLSGAARRVAELVSWNTIVRGTRVDFDAAIARVVHGETADADVCSLSKPDTVVAPGQLSAVCKRGRSSTAARPVQQGYIDEHDLDLSVAVPGGSILYVDQFKAVPFAGHGRFSDYGDSGSLIVMRDAPNSAVGLLVGGDPGGTYSFATPLSRVLKRLNATLA